MNDYMPVSISAHFAQDCESVKSRVAIDVPMELTRKYAGKTKQKDGAVG